MKSFVFVVALFAMSLAHAASAPSLPDTPAGRFVATWLAAYNSANVEQIERYRAAYARKSPAQVWIDMHEMTGRLTPLKVEAASPNEIVVLLAAENGDAVWQEKVTIDPADPMKVIDAGLSPGERPPEFAISRLPRAALASAMDAKLARDVAADRFAGVVLVQRHGKVIHRYAGGLADRASRTPVTMDTRFRIGSANKMVTAVAVRQLLSHTGGAGDIFTPEYDAKRLQVRTLADYVTLFGARAQDTTPDGKGAYSNYGFVLLGRIVEAVSGEDYYAYVRRHVYARAGMKHTDSLPEDVAVPKRSRGYMKKDGALADNADTLPWRASSAGGGYTTAADLLRFADALRAGRLVSKATLAQATSPQRLDGWYGFGFMVSGSGPTLNWGHGGGAPGMNAAFRVYPALDSVVVALSNLDPMSAEDEADFYANRMALEE